MNEEKIKTEKKEEKQKERARPEKKEDLITLVRIMATDINGEMKTMPGLTKIKGVSWSFSNAVCRSLNLDKNKKIKELSKAEIEKIAEFIRNPKLPNFLFNRKKDFDSGKDEHLTGSDLDLKEEFDIKRLKKIRCYKGWR